MQKQIWPNLSNPFVKAIAAAEESDGTADEMDGGEPMKVLVACEESQRVCGEFRKKGHEAYSCDIQECSGGHPEWHIMGDVLPLLDGHCNFQTIDGTDRKIEGGWDMIIAFPPCTHLAVSGARHFEKKRDDGRQLQGLWFFCQFLKADCERICIENPVNIISGDYVRANFRYHAMKYGLPLKPTQFIQPYWFGDPVRKKTQLWLKGLPKLVPANMVEPEIFNSKGKAKGFSGPSWIARDEDGKILRYNDPMTAKIRSKTYLGVAKAMADQWG